MEKNARRPPLTPPGASTGSAYHLHIHPTRGWAAINFAELWEYRELIYFLTWRDIKVRYKQTILGILWAILQPLFSMVIFSIFLGNLAKVPSDGLPYPIFNFAALVPWTFFSGGITQAANSLVASSNLVKKVYFPRLAIPISAVASGLIDFFLAMFVLAGLMIFYQIFPGWKALFLPILIGLLFLATLGIGLWLTVLNVQFRDVRYAVPFLVQAWMFASPTVYPSSLLSEPWRTLYGINPMTGILEGFRWALLEPSNFSWNMFLLSVISTIILFSSGLIYFRRMEKMFADVV